MLVKRNVYFSAVDEIGEEKLFSVTEIIDEKEYLERMYSKKEEEKPKKKNLIGNMSSGRGNGRAYAVGGYAGVIGRAAGNHAATKEARKGGSDEEVMNKGKKVATRTGAATGAAIGAVGTGAGVAAAMNANGIGSVKELGNNVKKLTGKAVKERYKTALAKGDVKAIAKNKELMKKIGKASGSKVGKAVVGGTVAAGALAAGVAGGMGSKLGVKKAIKERTEKAQTERDNR